MKAWVIVAFACAGPTHVVVGGRLSFDAPVPVRDLHWQGIDTAVGGYRVGRCVVSYEIGQYANPLTEDALDFPADYQMRIAPLDGKPARWVRYRETIRGEVGPYHGGAYRSGATIYVDCPSAAERDAALDIASTVHFAHPPEPGVSDVPVPPGRTDWRAPPESCVREDGGPGPATVEVAAAPGVTQLWQVTLLRRGESVSDWFNDDASPTAIATLTGPTGTYDVFAEVDGERFIRCRDVGIVAGRTTRVRILGLPP